MSIFCLLSNCVGHNLYRKLHCIANGGWRAILYFISNSAWPCMGWRKQRRNTRQLSIPSAGMLSAIEFYVFYMFHFMSDDVACKRLHVLRRCRWMDHTSDTQLHRFILCDIVSPAFIRQCPLGRKPDSFLLSTLQLLFAIETTIQSHRDLFRVHGFRFDFLLIQESNGTNCIVWLSALSSANHDL